MKIAIGLLLALVVLSVFFGAQTSYEIAPDHSVFNWSECFRTLAACGLLFAVAFQVSRVSTVRLHSIGQLRWPDFGWLALVLVVAVYLNCHCRVFFGPGSTTALTFSQGWPVPYQEGAILSPDWLQAPSDYVPTRIWGHPEYNADPRLMNESLNQIRNLSLSPWQLHELSETKSWIALGAMLADLLMIVVFFSIPYAIREIKRKG